MKYTCFCPGPAQVYPEIKQYLTDAYEAGVLSMQHRSEEFVSMSQNVVRLLQEKLNIPHDYRIFYVSSATECWEIITQAFPEYNSHHFFNGSFGERWYTYRKRLVSDRTFAYPFELESLFDAPSHIAPESLICLTHNETSNATKLTWETFATLRQTYPDSLIAVDAVSSFGGVTLDWKMADFWFTSLQKCLGLPAGMGLLVASPRAIAAAQTLNHKKHYNSLLFLEEKMQLYQTTHTPNVLNIYLLMRVLEQRKNIQIINKNIEVEAQKWYTFLNRHKQWSSLVQNQSVRSDTVIAIKAQKDNLFKIKDLALKKGFQLGNGYGSWKQNTFRIANFPAIPAQAHEALRTFLDEVVF